MRILVLFWRFAMLVGGLTVAAQGSTADLATSRIDRVREAGVLRVCIWPDYYSITYRNPKTQLLSGIDIDLAGELGKDLGVAVQFVDSSFVVPVLEVGPGCRIESVFGVGRYRRGTEPV